MLAGDISLEEQAARIRAAIGWSGLELSEILERLPFSEQTLRRRYDAKSPRPVRSMEELYMIADACDVPRAFMAEGWARYADGADDASMLERVASTEATLRRLSEALERLAGATEEQIAELRRELLGHVQDAAAAAIARGPQSLREGDRRRAGPSSID